MSQNFSRHNKRFILAFNEHSNWQDTLRIIRKAFTDGFTCFEFVTKIRGRTFRDRVALRPEMHDEKAAVEMAHEMWMKFENTIQKVLGA